MTPTTTGRAVGGAETGSAPYSRFYRSAGDTRRTFKRTWRLFGLYFTVSNCSVKKRHTCGYNLNQRQQRKNLRRKQHLLERQGGTCPHCGTPLTDHDAELHHILPLARFSDLCDDERNMIALCHQCHKEVHCNPWLNIRLMEQKATELSIDLSERYERK